MPLTVIRVSEITPKSKDIILLAEIFTSDPASIATLWLTTTLDPIRISLLLATVADIKATLVASMLTEDSSWMTTLPIAYFRPETAKDDALNASACPMAYLRPKITIVDVLLLSNPDWATLVADAVTEEPDWTSNPLDLTTLPDAETVDWLVIGISPITYLIAAEVDALCVRKAAWPRLTP
jgi:hypothetical protein